LITISQYSKHFPSGVFVVLSEYASNAVYCSVENKIEVFLSGDTPVKFAFGIK